MYLFTTISILYHNYYTLISYNLNLAFFCLQVKLDLSTIYLLKHLYIYLLLMLSRQTNVIILLSSLKIL